MAEEDGHDYEILLSCTHGLSAEQVVVEYSREYDRQPHPEPENEQKIETTWLEKKQRQPTLYNGTKFRYSGFRVLDSETRPSAPTARETTLRSNQADPVQVDGGEVERANKVCLHLGLCDYRTFAGTNLRDDWRVLLPPSAASDVERCRHLADPLGNAALVRTSDNAVLLLQRGQAVGEFPDHPVFPGGHSEPVEVGIAGDEADKCVEEVQQLNTLIGMEMFAGIVREVHEETGAPPDSLGELRFLGIVRRKLNSRPVAMFACECALTAAQVQECYEDAEHKFESTQLRAVPLESLEEESLRMPGCHRGGAALALAFLEHQGLLQ